ncbi:MAG: hypothetical protein AB7Q42_16530 [Acidimicrobiia bacterium]
MRTSSSGRLALLAALILAGCSGSSNDRSDDTAAVTSVVTSPLDPGSVTAGPNSPPTTAARPIVELPANGSVLVADGAALVFYAPDGSQVGSADIVLRDEPLLELGGNRALGVTDAGSVVVLDGSAGTAEVVEAIDVPDGARLNRDVIGGGERFTIAQVGDDPYLVDLDASTATLLTTITSIGRRVQGWRFSSDERFVASTGTYLTLIPTADPAQASALAELSGCVSIDASGRLLVSETGGEIGSVSLATVEDPAAKQALFAGATKCALWWGDRIVAYGTGALVELHADGTTTELLDLEPGQVVTMPVAGHPELVSVSGGVNPNQWFWLQPDNSMLPLPEAEGGRYVDVVGDVAAFALDSSAGFDLVVASGLGGTTNVTPFTDDRLGTRVLDIGGAAYVGAADGTSVVRVEGGTSTAVVDGASEFVLAADRSGLLAVALPEGVAIIGPADPAARTALGPGRPIAWLSA